MRFSFFSTQELLENLAPDDIVIVVIGPTGVGKSSLINVATHSNLQVGAGMSPCTKKFAYVRCTLEDSRKVVFVDTPAFPNPDVGKVKLSDLEKKEGKKIREWINDAFGKNIKVTGILYLHRMTDNRLTEPLPHYEIFRKLCGDQFKGSVVLVLTMCEQVNDATFQDRMKYLTTHWKGVMSGKAAVCSHHGTKKSAWDVVAALGVGV